MAVVYYPSLDRGEAVDVEFVTLQGEVRPVKLLVDSGFTGRSSVILDHAASELIRAEVPAHLVMPGRLNDTRQIVGWLALLSKDSYLNVMDQDYSAWKAKTNPRFADINRSVSRPEVQQALELARGAGLWRLDERWRKISVCDAMIEG
jgi:hypothetical protein